MLTTSSMSSNSNRCRVSASRSSGPIVASSRISANVRSITSRNSVSDLKIVIESAQSNLAPVIHLHPTAPLAERVLLPGDPGRALLLAQALLDAPKMFNHHRGLWGYTGAAADGAPLTIQSTGMGGPSAAIVVSELIELGARQFVRVGTCGALDGSLSLGELLIATAAIPDDGTSRALGAPTPVAADVGLVGHLRGAAGPEASAGL